MDNNNRVLLILTLGVLMGAIDTTIVLLALPTINSDLHTTLIASVWVILAYLLVIAVATTQFGRIGDIYGRSKMFNMGFGIFTIGSLLCGLAPTIIYLILFRFLQGIGGALLQSNSGAIVADTFEPKKRGRAFGYTSLGWSVGAMLGIILGGVLTTFTGWRYIFYINVPIGIIATYLGIKYIRDNPRIKSRIDWHGMVLLTASLILVSYSAIDMAAEGVSQMSLGMIVAGIALLILFFFGEKKSRNPMMNLGIFRSNKILTYSILATFFMSLGYLAVVFIIIMYLQGIRGLSPLDASLLLIPGYIVSSISAPYMGRLADRHGARILATLGLALMVITVLIYSTLTATSSLYIILAASFVSGIGIAMFFPANSSAIMSNADREHYGSISGLTRFMQNIGTLCSYVITLTVASLAVPRAVAFEVFLGTSKLIGGVSADFLDGIHASLLISLAILIIAAALSYMRGGSRKNAGSINRWGK
ncbi:MFS transporter [Candidatus Marsarchaeota archaeon]|nr:MFS transporter [Candidatus Marsarchaeota archaeon]